ncbi:NACHT, LRR and PYD domains-containing protein 3-like [Hoplias malabaricus]|uniref:NACHT, LRR and PYD domains-containing protein 3-like n=1 Tax=Hoplias malabaricus TaxID=27720 RepID=UPI0034622A61
MDADSDSLQTKITAHSGGTVCAPVLHGNLFHGQVVFNLHGAEKPSSSRTNTAQVGSTAESPAFHEEQISVNKQKHKSKLQKKFQKVNEGLANQGNASQLNDIYTELYITEGGSGEVNIQHEVRQIKITSRKQEIQDTPVKCNDIFKALPGQDKQIRTVLTRGIAGIGKTISVQKFILDWAEGNANQDITIIFPLPFRELNLMKGKKLSLTNLLHCLFPDTEILPFLEFDSTKVIFIFDGLDEYRLPLDFQSNDSLFNPDEPASVDVLLTNIIRGNLLPSALLWITTRPAAANRIPPECVDQVTEIRGFSDSQKEEYFRKSISDENLAEKIITHIKSTRSLYIMCHIPVFCWIAATVLEKMFDEAKNEEIPRTLTQMFTRFLIFQTKQGSQKYQGNCVLDPQQARECFLALGKLAFQQLENGNLIFYEEDLRKCGINVREASVYSGVYTQIFRDEFQLDQVFTFVHLSLQEFLAALYAFLSFILNKENVLKPNASGMHSLFSKSSMTMFLKNAVDKALQSENGHLDLFLRFLLGLSLETNQTLLKSLLPQRTSNSHSIKEIIKYIKKKIKDISSPEKSINLFYCLNELKDQSLEQEVQTYLSESGSDLSKAKLSPAQWSALVFVLLNSEEDLDIFDLGNYVKSEECLVRMLPVVQASTCASISYCNITEKSCGALASAISSTSSSLRVLNLSHNQLQDSGVKLLSVGLKSPQCKLKMLWLEKCSFTDKGCAALAKALKSNPSHLIELHLNYNKPGDSGIKELAGLLEDPQCKLEKLQLCNCSITWEGCTALVTALKSNPSHLRELNLNWNAVGDTGVKDLCDLLRDPRCKLEKLLLECCRVTEEGCAALVKSLKSNPSHLTELNIKYNNLADSGMKLLSSLLKDTDSSLQTLQLGLCNLTDENCATLASALSSETLSLRNLYLSYNKLHDSGVKLLSAGLENPHCKLETLFLGNCDLTQKSCATLASALCSKSSCLRELDLSKNNIKDSGVKLLSAGLDDPRCKLETLSLVGCDITKKSCEVLGSVLSSKFSSLRELQLGFSALHDSGVTLLSAALESANCKLETLGLSGCEFTEESCAALASALSSESSSLKVLNLYANNLGDSGLKLISAGMANSNCKLEALGLFYCLFSEDGYASLVLALKLNPSHIKLLNVGSNVITDSGVELLSALLENPHCKLEQLKLKNCSLTKKSCVVLASALNSNSSCLSELDLSNNNLQDSGVKLLSAGLESPLCKLKYLKLCGCNLTAKSCAALSSALSSNSSILSELYLSKNDLQDSGVKLLSAGLGNTHCKLQKLELEHCSIKEEGCAALIRALKSNPSNLRELSLQGNKLGAAGVKELSGLLDDPHCKLEELCVMPYHI